MDRLQSAALLTRLVQALRGHESWAGETHTQKAAFMLQELLGVPLDFQFVLYRHGPFSFDLHDELTALRGDELIEFEMQQPPYGPRFATTEQARYIQKQFPKTLDKYKKQIEFIADRFGNRGVASLEKLATAYYVTKKRVDSSKEERAGELVNLKPHISMEAALKAVGEVDEMIAAANELRN